MSKPGPVPAILLLAFLAAADRADGQPLVTDRPDFTESAMAVVPGRVQAEGGWSFTRADGPDEHAVGELLLRIGVLAGAELRVELPSWIEAGGASGPGDGGIGAKLELAAGAPDVALLVATTVPVGESDVGAEGWQPGATLAAAWDLSERLSLGTNLGWTWALDGDDRLHEASASAALGAALGERLGAFVEAFGFATDDDAGPAWADGGVTFLVHDDLQLDARAGAGLFQAAGDWFVGAGLSRRW